MNGTPRVRRSIRRLASWVFPVLVLIAAWQIWDAVEARRLSRELEDMFPGGVDSSLARGEPNDAAAYYAALNLTAVSAGWVATLDNPGAPPPSPRELVLRYRSVLSIGQQPVPEDVANLARVLSAYELPLRLMRDGSALPYGHNENITQGSYRFSGFLSIQDVLSAHTLELVRTGPADAAVESLISRVKLLRAYRLPDGPFAVSLKATQAAAIAVDTGLVLSRLRPSDAALGQLGQALLAAYDDDEIEQFMRVDARQGYQTFESIATGRRVETGRVVVVARPGLRHLMTEGVQTARELTAASRLPWPERLHAIDRVDDRESALISFLVRPFLPWRGTRLPTWPIAAQASGMALTIAGGIASVRVAEAAVEVARSGTAPASLDPFSGKPLRYIRGTDGFTIYSIDRDFRDDGGAIDPVPGKGQAPGYARSPDNGVRVRRSPIPDPS